MIALTVQKWETGELLLFKEAVNNQRKELQKTCPKNILCKDCPNDNLCKYYRDAFIVTSKELKKRQ
nr:MAG TPA: hypothetical protein [Caudoviricetes sp.]